MNAERDHYTLKAVVVAMNDLSKEVRGYRDDSTHASAKLDEHIRSCDRRYVEMRVSRGESTNVASSDSFGKSWLLKKVSDRIFDYVVFAIIALLIFAFKHGATLPIPSP